MDNILECVWVVETLPPEINIKAYNDLKLEYFKILGSLKWWKHVNNTQTISTRVEIHFPKINVPKFSGNFLKKIFEN